MRRRCARGAPFFLAEYLLEQAGSYLLVWINRQSHLCNDDDRIWTSRMSSKQRLSFGDQSTGMPLVRRLLQGPRAGYEACVVQEAYEVSVEKTAQGTGARTG